MLVEIGRAANGLRSTTRCNSNTFWQCKNGDCIGFAERCNGIVNCRDASDETAHECISMECDVDQLRCAYGACVNGTAECNAINECADKSDELTDKCLPNIDETIRGKCAPKQFHCKSGECIPIIQLCDGKKDCVDASGIGTFTANLNRKNETEFFFLDFFMHSVEF